jgi:predicted metalloprotease
MRWSPGGRSENLEDRRGASPRGFGGGGFGGGRGLGLGGIVILLVLSLIFKQDFLSLAGGGGGSAPPAGAAPINDPAEEQQVQFVSFVLDDAQGVWAQELPTLGTAYRPATLVLFRDAVESACGLAQAASGPFYCPGDQKVYIDLSFWQQLGQMGASGEFAQAYVLAHELGHHVQTLLGTSQQVSRLQQTRPEVANQASVLLELQADCFAGVWGHSAAQRNKLDPGEAEQGLRAAAAVGDDHLQKMSTGRVSPESFTHGSSEQRMMWFRRGFETGDPRQCDTFSRPK